eukprot:4574192-Amphidinium_carterae.1
MMNYQMLSNVSIGVTDIHSRTELLAAQLATITSRLETQNEFVCSQSDLNCQLATSVNHIQQTVGQLHAATAELQSVYDPSSVAQPTHLSDQTGQDEVSANRVTDDGYDSLGGTDVGLARVDGLSSAFDSLPPL